ncbi:MAG: CotH kinase family protein, partial [Syntrophaceae bacterium]|nr:CotH kinase family protein [Syntrophaceae bacterium]
MRFLIFIFSLWTAVSALATENIVVHLDSSNLPIVIIETNGNTIRKDVRIAADMQIIWNDDHQRNRVTDTPNNYNGKIGIELHGQSSLSFTKKSYRIETRDSSGANLNVSLLGMPKENDWILYGPYSDKTLMRNVLSYTLASEISGYAPRTRFCELIMNRVYVGVYVLTEKIKLDKNRVNITQMLPGDIAEPEITGGYIFKKDKTDPGDNIIHLNRGLDLVITEPKNDEIVP